MSDTGAYAYESSESGNDEYPGHVDSEGSEAQHQAYENRRSVSEDSDTNSQTAHHIRQVWRHLDVVSDLVRDAKRYVMGLETERKNLVKSLASLKYDDRERMVNELGSGVLYLHQSDFASAEQYNNLLANFRTVVGMLVEAGLDTSILLVPERSHFCPPKRIQEYVREKLPIMREWIEEAEQEFKHKIKYQKPLKKFEPGLLYEELFEYAEAMNSGVDREELLVRLRKLSPDNQQEYFRTIFLPVADLIQERRITEFPLVFRTLKELFLLGLDAGIYTENLELDPDLLIEDEEVSERYEAIVRRAIEKWIGERRRIASARKAVVEEELERHLERKTQIGGQTASFLPEGLTREVTKYMPFQFRTRSPRRGSRRKSPRKSGVRRGSKSPRKTSVRRGSKSPKKSSKKRSPKTKRRSRR